MCFIVMLIYLWGMLADFQKWFIENKNTVLGFILQIQSCQSNFVVNMD